MDKERLMWILIIVVIVLALVGYYFMVVVEAPLLSAKPRGPNSGDGPNTFGFPIFFPWDLCWQGPWGPIIGGTYENGQECLDQVQTWANECGACCGARYDSTNNEQYDDWLECHNICGAQYSIVASGCPRA
jgi:hypothetical protein